MNQNNSCQYHPDTLTINAFAAGTIDTAEGLCIASHVQQCAECKHQLNQLETVGESFFMQPSQVLIAKGAKEGALKAIRQAKQVKPAPRTPTTSSSVPKVLYKWIPNGYDELDWQTITREISTFDLTKNKKGTKVSLLKVKAGAHMPHHRHSGKEITVILQGSFSDEDGIYSEGDYLVRETHENHSPIASKDKDCICLTLLDGPIELTGFFSKLLNPILRLKHSA
jgi:putative transcriptional regulator